MPRKTKEPRHCDDCEGVKNVRLTAREDGTLCYICGPCRYSASRRSEEAEAASYPETPHDSEHAVFRHIPLRRDPRVCSACGDPVEAGTGDDECAECMEKRGG